MKADTEKLEASRFALVSFIEGDAKLLDRVQAEKTAQHLGQQYFDLSVASYMVVANLALERAVIDGGSSAILKRSEAHLLHVRALASEIGRGTHGASAHVVLVDEINATRRRLEGDLERANSKRGRRSAN